MNKIDITKNFSTVILAGGKSSRFGSDKAFSQFKEKSLIETIFNELSKQFNEILVSIPADDKTKSENNSDKYSFLNCETIPDLIEEMGPLGGLYSVMSKKKSEYFLFIPCDMPLFSVKSANILIDDYNNAVDMNINNACSFFTSDERIQPFPLLVNKELFFSELEKRINSNSPKVTKLLSTFGNKGLDINIFKSIFSENMFYNCNTIQDLKKLNS